MVRSVARGVHRFELPAPTGDFLAVTHDDIGVEIPVAAFLDAGLAAPPASMRSKPVAGRPSL